MVLLTCRGSRTGITSAGCGGSRTGTTSAGCGGSRTYIRKSFDCEQIFQDFLSHLSMLYWWLMEYLQKNM
jgi:hypothetical protein